MDTNYTAYAWLPGSTYFMVEDETGQPGFLSPEGFEPRTVAFFDAAIASGYVRIAPTLVNVPGARSLAERLAMP